MQAMPILISFFSYGFIQDCLETYFQHFPNQQILIIDNNPDEHKKCYLSYRHRRFPMHATKLVAAEREWLNSQKNVIIYRPETSNVLTHGEVLDVGNQWCRKNGVDIYVHLESDCIIYGRKWYDKLVSTIIDEDMWVASGWFFNPSQTLHPTPAAWRVDKVDMSFNATRRIYDYHKGNKQSRITEKFQKHHWDTASQYFANCNVIGKTKLVEVTDFKHLWQGSVRMHPKQILF